MDVRPFFNLLLENGISSVFLSDQNNLMTMSNVVFKRLYPKEYTSDVSTRVSNALLVGET